MFILCIKRYPSGDTRLDGEGPRHAVGFCCYMVRIADRPIYCSPDSDWVTDQTAGCTSSFCIFWTGQIVLQGNFRVRYRGLSLRPEPGGLPGVPSAALFPDTLSFLGMFSWICLYSLLHSRTSWPLKPGSAAAFMATVRASKRGDVVCLHPSGGGKPEPALHPPPILVLHSVHRLFLGIIAYIALSCHVSLTGRSSPGGGAGRIP